MRPVIPLLVLLALTVPSAAAEFGRYDEMGYPINVLGESTFPGRAAGPINVVGGVTVYPYWGILTLELQRLASDHPGLVKLHSTGKSTLGLDLWMLEIADFDNPDMKALETREVVWVDGGTHSNEYSGVYFTAHLASFLLDEYETNETARWIVENRHTFIMPLVNPDGGHAFGRLNAKTVNINRNYPVAWGALEETPVLNNPGPHPASEIETRINIEWFNKTRPDYYASIHCCGNLWLYPYGVDNLDPPDNEVLSRVCDEAFASVRKSCGPIWSTIYPASGSSVDTAYEYTGTVGFGYEMSGRGALLLWGQPFTTASVREQETESWAGILHAFLNVHKYGAYPQIISASVTGNELRLTVRNEGYGNLTEGTVTLEDAAGVEHTIALPFLAPGDTADIPLAPTLATGPAIARLDYAKRLVTAPQGALDVTLHVREASGGGFEIFAIGDAPLDLASAPDAGRDVPSLTAAFAIAAAGLVAFGRRRRA